MSAGALTPGRALAIIRDLEKILRAERVLAGLAEPLRALQEQLTGEWGMRALPLAIFGDTLPPELRSSRVSIFRRGSQSRLERHPNADQFSCILSGALTIHVWEGESGWRARTFRAAGHAQQRISHVARGIWHHPHCPATEDCQLVAFHTVGVAELQDETAATRAAAERL